MKKLIGGEKIYIKYIIICLYYYKLSAAKTSRDQPTMRRRAVERSMMLMDVGMG